MNDLPSIEVVHSWKMPDSIRRAALELCNEAYREDLGGYFADLEPDFHVLARIGSRLVGHGMVVTRWLQAGGNPPLRTAYVELVATAPGFRRQRIGAAVMRNLAKAAVAGGYELAALCPGDTGLYSKLGWEYWQGPLFIRCNQVTGKDEMSLIATPEERVMILRLPATPCLDLTQPLSAEWREGSELW